MTLINVMKKKDQQHHLHTKKLLMFNFNMTGNYIASLSKGTIIKITETMTQQTLKKIWVNNQQTEFSCLVFSEDDHLLAAVERQTGKVRFKLWKQEADKKKQDNFFNILNRTKDDFKIKSPMLNSVGLFSKDNKTFILYDRVTGINKYAVDSTSKTAQLVQEVSYVALFPK